MFFKKTETVAVAMKIPRRVLIEKSIEALAKTKFNKPDNYSQILAQNHLWYISSLNEDIRTAEKAKKIAICLKRNGIKTCHYNKEENLITAKYIENVFYIFSSAANSSEETDPVKVFGYFVAGCNYKITQANKSKPFLDQEVGLTAEELKVLGVDNPEQTTRN